MRRSLTAVLAAAVALVAVPSAHAYHPPQLVRTIGTSAHDKDPSKSATAKCPPGTKVIGGGGAFNNAITGDVRFVSLVPTSVDGGRNNAFAAVAEKDAYIRGYDWSVRAYAVCAPPMPEYQVVASGASGSRPFRTASRECPGSTVAYGSGAAIAGAFGHVGLQTNRTSDGLTRAYAAAREDIHGSDYRDWSVYSYAICGRRLDGIHSVSAVQSGPWTPGISCPPGEYVHGPGGGVPLFDNGWVFLGEIVPVRDLRSSLMAVSTLPTGHAIHHHITCAR